MNIDIAKFRTIVGHSPYRWSKLYPAAGISLSSAYRYWKGTRPLPLEAAARLAYYMGVPLSSFVDQDTIWLLRQVSK